MSCNCISEVKDNHFHRTKRMAMPCTIRTHGVSLILSFFGKWRVTDQWAFRHAEWGKKSLSAAIRWDNILFRVESVPPIYWTLSLASSCSGSPEIMMKWVNKKTVWGDRITNPGARKKKAAPSHVVPRPRCPSGLKPSCRLPHSQIRNWIQWAESNPIRSRR